MVQYLCNHRRIGNGRYQAIRSGLHTGEVELRSWDVSGVAVHVAARVEALAGSASFWSARP